MKDINKALGFFFNWHETIFFSLWLGEKWKRDSGAICWNWEHLNGNAVITSANPHNCQIKWKHISCHPKTIEYASFSCICPFFAGCLFVDTFIYLLLPFIIHLHIMIFKIIPFIILQQHHHHFHFPFQAESLFVGTKKLRIQSKKGRLLFRFGQRV